MRRTLDHRLERTRFDGRRRLSVYGILGAIPTKQMFDCDLECLRDFTFKFVSFGSGSVLIFFLMFIFKSRKIVGTDIFHTFIL